MVGSNSGAEVGGDGGALPAGHVGVHFQGRREGYFPLRDSQLLPHRVTESTIFLRIIGNFRQNRPELLSYKGYDELFLFERALTVDRDGS
jgi:hypothetical protein